MDKRHKDSLIQSTITALCLFPLFFYVKILCFLGDDFLILTIVHLLAGIPAFCLLLFRRTQWEQPKRRWFWIMMPLSTLGIVLFFRLARYFHEIEDLMILCILIQLLFPAFHLILEVRKRKRFFMKVLLCIYIFCLVLGCTILFLGKDSTIEFFPITALSGILLEIFALRGNLTRVTKYRTSVTGP